MEIFFFDVPVYRIPEERYYAEREAYVEKAMYPPDAPWTQLTRELHQRDRPIYIAALDHFEQSYGGMWRYNEIVGYIRLKFLESQIRGEYFGVTVKRMVRTRTKIFEYQTYKLVPEMDVPPNTNSEEIFRLIQQYLAACRNELPKRYIDTKLLDTVGPYIDWRRLYGDHIFGTLIGDR